MVRWLRTQGARFVREDLAFRGLLQNSSWLLSGDAITVMLTLVQGVIAARVLGAEQFGIFTLITTYTVTVNQLVDSRVWETAIKFLIHYREKGDAIRATAIVKLCYAVDAVTNGLAFGILILTAGLAAHIFVKDASTANSIKLYAISTLIAVPVGTSTALLRVADRFDWLAYQKIVVAVSKLLGVGVALLLGTGIPGLLIAHLLAAVIGVVMLLAFARRVSGELGLVPGRQASLSSLRGEYRRIVQFLAATNGNALFKLLQRNADILMIGYWLTPTAVGYFRIARSMTDLVNFPVAPLYTASYPEFARLWHQEKLGVLRRLVHKLTVSSSSVAFVALLLIWVLGASLIRLTVGDQYLPALPVLRWLALGTCIAVATNFGHPLLLAIDRASHSLLAIALGVIGQLTLLVVLLPLVGLVAGGIGYLGFYLIWVTVVAISARDVWGYRLAA